MSQTRGLSVGKLRGLWQTFIEELNVSDNNIISAEPGAEVSKEKNI